MTAGRRDQLATALDRALADAHMTDNQAAEVIGLLLPVVDRMIRQAQAEALEEAAQHFDRMASPTLHNDPFIRASDWAARIIRDRAAALRVTTDQPGSTHDAPTTPPAAR